MTVHKRAVSRFYGPLFLAALLASGCDLALGNLGARATDEWTRTYTIKAGGELRIVNTNGRIEVEPAEGNQVEVKAERIARATTESAARELLPRITIKEDAQADKVRLETERLAGFLIGAAIEVRYHVRVPKNIDVNLSNTNGSISLDRLPGKVVARTTNGAVRGQSLTGAVEARTTNGSVSIDMAALGPDPISAHTTNGGVTIALPDDAKASVTASWTNGGIRVAPELKIDATEQSRRRFEGRLNGGGTPINLETTNGGIRVRSRSASTES